MDDTKTRNISVDVLNSLKKKCSGDFFELLPISSEVLLKYAKRRTDPVISDSINKNLKDSMLDHRLSDEEYLYTFFKSIINSFKNKKMEKSPLALILLAQTGAGKTNLRTKIFNDNRNIVTINSDEYKKYRRDSKEILKEDPTHFGALTGIDSYDHAKNIMDFAVDNSYNVLVESAPSRTQGIIGVDFDKLDKVNYKTSYHILAVGDLVSSLAIHLRYEYDMENKKDLGDTKLTGLDRHDESYEALAKVVETLEGKECKIYRRGEENENFIPVEIFPKNNETLPFILKTLRDRSNFEYIKSGEFQEKFSNVENSMKERNADKTQFAQLWKVKEKYYKYLENQRDEGKELLIR